MEEQIARPHIVVVGAGFGGMAAVRALQNANADITLIDRNNYQLFQPLLPQGAAGRLSIDDLATPIRDFLQGQANVRFLMAEVKNIQIAERTLVTDVGELAFDYLILAAGSVPSFMGIEQIAGSVFTLKKLDDVWRFKNHLLKLFEQASILEDGARRKKFLTILCVGGGSAGVASAAALAELVQNDLKRQYPRLKVSDVDIRLLDFGDSLLPSMPAAVQQLAEKMLQNKSIQVLHNVHIESYDGNELCLESGETIASRTLLWLGGINASPLAAVFQESTDAAGRIFVNDYLQLPEDKTIYVIGDMARFTQNEKPLPPGAWIAAAEGRAAASNIRAEITARPYKAFQYGNETQAVPLGRKEAIFWNSGLKTGTAAWLSWLRRIYDLLQYHSGRKLWLFRYFFKLNHSTGLARLIATPSEGIKSNAAHTIADSSIEKGDEKAVTEEQKEAKETADAKTQADENERTNTAEDAEAPEENVPAENGGQTAKEQLDAATGELDRKLRRSRPLRRK